MDRRSFVERLAGSVVLSRLPEIVAQGSWSEPLNPSLRVLVLGGTNYVGPQIAQAALERGHRVTLFNRGFHNPEILPRAERLHGNRYRHRTPGLRALAGSREWDLVVDTWAGPPGCVHDTVSLLADRTARYVYVSSVAVLGGFHRVGLNEDATTVEADEHVGSHDADLAYAVRKRASELAVLQQLGRRATVLRCSAIWGHDPTGAQLSYWGVRFLSGEPFLVPDDRTAVIQWTDVRDLGRFAIHAGENDLGGVFHLISPRHPIPLWQVLQAWERVTGSGHMVPASPEFLARNELRAWIDIPHYIPEDDPEPGFYRVDARRAHATDFAFRAIEETVADEAATCPRVSPALAPRGRLTRHRELELAFTLL